MGDCINRETAIVRATKVVENILDAYTVKENLQAIPAADVAPVRHGRWEWYDSFSYRCSACKKYWIAPGDQYDYHYCPNCGARMDGGQEV